MYSIADNSGFILSIFRRCVKSTASSLVLKSVPIVNFSVASAAVTSATSSTLWNGELLSQNIWSIWLSCQHGNTDSIAGISSSTSMIAFFNFSQLNYVNAIPTCVGLSDVPALESLYQRRMSTVGNLLSTKTCHILLMCCIQCVLLPTDDSWTCSSMSASNR